MKKLLQITALAVILFLVSIEIYCLFNPQYNFAILYRLGFYHKLPEQPNPKDCVFYDDFQKLDSDYITSNTWGAHYRNYWHSEDALLIDSGLVFKIYSKPESHKFYYKDTLRSRLFEHESGMIRSRHFKITEDITFAAKITIHPNVNTWPAFWLFNGAHEFDIMETSGDPFSSNFSYHKYKNGKKVATSISGYKNNWFGYLLTIKESETFVYSITFTKRAVIWKVNGYTVKRMKRPKKNLDDLFFILNSNTCFNCFIKDMESMVCSWVAVY